MVAVVYLCSASEISITLFSIYLFHQNLSNIKFIYYFTICMFSISICFVQNIESLSAVQTHILYLHWMTKIIKMPGSLSERRTCRLNVIRQINVIATTNEAFSEWLRLSLLTVAIIPWMSSTSTTTSVIVQLTNDRNNCRAVFHHRLICNHILHNLRIVRVNSRIPSPDAAK